MLQLQRAEFAYEPFPICYIPQVIAPDIYTQMCEAYPGAELFKSKPELGYKISLSEVNNGKQYAEFIQATPVWREFHRYMKSPDFIHDTLAFLKKNHIDLALPRMKIASNVIRKKPSILSRLKRETEVTARFEFSMMEPDGGHILPHTDGQNKLITLVISMMKPGEWQEVWGGGTDMCLPKDRTRIYNQANKYAAFDDMDVLKTYPFLPNQCVLFIKTYNSWHQVRPIQAPKGAPFRKTLTINIESRA